jgi:hypothetical protein
VPKIIQLGLSDAIAQAAKQHADLLTALPSNEASVVVNGEGVTAIAGVDIGPRVTVGAWVSRQWTRAWDYGAALRIKVGGSGK